jgi:predicted RNA binding protein YcfA (HicA-like mRNA interferase family)
MPIVPQVEKILNKMKANPRDWRIESLKSVAEANNIAFRRPGGSHVIFRHTNGAMLSVPAHRPIKPVYIRKFVRFIEHGVSE